MKTESGPIVDQVVVVEGDELFVNIYFANTDILDVNVSVNLVDPTGNSVPLTPSSNIDKNNNKIYFKARVPAGHDLTAYSLI